MLDNLVYFPVAIAASPNLHDVNQVFGTLTDGIFLAFIAASGVAWVLSLFDATRCQRWGWFIFVLPLPLLAAGAAFPLGLASGAGGPKTRPCWRRPWLPFPACSTPPSRCGAETGQIS